MKIILYLLLFTVLISCVSRSEYDDTVNYLNQKIDSLELSCKLWEGKLAICKEYSLKRDSLIISSKNYNLELENSYKFNVTELGWYCYHFGWFDGVKGTLSTSEEINDLCWEWFEKYGTGNWR